jgi:microcystin-dependent protein
LLTSVEVQALTEPSKSVTPGSLAGMIASETQLGFVELATTPETQAFLDNTRAVTAASIGSLNATTTTRGLVSLSDSTADPSVTTAPTANALKAYADSSLDTLSVTAQGDLIVGLDYQVPGIVPKGTSRSFLTVDDTKAFQGSLDWNVPDSLVSWPVGAIIWYPAPLAPTSLWMECDGRLLDASITSPYYDLYDLIGTTYNQAGDPAGSFRIPDLRGVFVRGWSGSGPNPTPTALDPGRNFASLQGGAYKQHFHTVTDPSHLHQFPLNQHAHPTNSGTVTHDHVNANPGHSHTATVKMSGFIVGDQGGVFDSNGQWGAPQGPFSNSVRTGVTVNSNSTNISVVNATTGLAINTITTGLTVDNSPPIPPSPNENRPYNIALLPMIKYRPA